MLTQSPASRRHLVEGLLGNSTF